MLLPSHVRQYPLRTDPHEKGGEARPWTATLMDREPAADLVVRGIPKGSEIYTTLSSNWPRCTGQTIRITIDSLRHRFAIPLEFVRASGDNTWRFVLYLLSILVNESVSLYNDDDALHKPVGIDGDGLEGAPTAERYTFRAAREEAWPSRIRTEVIGSKD